MKFSKVAGAVLLIGVVGISASFFAHVPLSQIPPIASASAASGSCSLNLQFLKTSGDTSQGGTITYLLTAKNLGTEMCTNASISVYYAANEHFGSASPAAAADGYYWRLGSLPPKGIEDISLATSRNAPLLTGQTPDEACLAADNGADACSDASGVTSQTAPVIVTQAAAVQAAPAQTQTQAQAPQQSQSVKQPPVSIPAENGVWEWTSAYGMSQATAQQIVNNAAANGFNVIYLTVDSSLNLSGAQLSNYEASLNTFLTDAAIENIAVDAEAGASSWALPGNWSNPQNIITFVANYNQTHTIKFRGVQFDIEPYSLPQYTQDPAGVLTDYVQMAESLVNQDKNYGMPLGFDIPFFYSAYAHAPQVTVDGITTYPLNHLVRLLNELPYGRLLVMAYRNFASGSDGTIEIAAPEIQAAGSSNVDVIVGQETGNVQPSYVTFYGMTKEQMAAQVAIVKQSFASDKSFGGIAVDYLEPYLQLK